MSDKVALLARKKSKVTHGELTGHLGEAAVSPATVEDWCRRFQQGNFLPDDKFRLGRLLSDIGEPASQILRKQPFLSACVFAKDICGKPPYNQRDSHARCWNEKIHAKMDSP